MRKKIIAGNWKMNKTPAEAKALVKMQKELLLGLKKAEVVFIPPFMDIPVVVRQVRGSRLKVGAQNMSDKDGGAYTGEISGAMLKASGVSYVILGHSERRAYYGETDEFINAKVKKALECGLNPILCVGETLTQREQGITMDLIRQQLKIALNEVPAEQAVKVVIAYEPVWAIGTGKTATAEQAQEVCHDIRETLVEIYNRKIANRIRIQYGGSMNASNAAELLAQPDIDGGLIGGASLKADFATIVKAAQ